MTSRPLVLVLALALLVVPAALAGHAGNHPSTRGNVDGRAPQAQTPDASASDDEPGTAGVQVHPHAGSSRTVDVTIDADDDNGHNDVTKAEVTVYKPDGTTVHAGIDAQQASKSSGNGKRATYTHAFSMNHYDEPGTYTIEVTITDRDGSTDTSSTTFSYESLSAVSTNTSTVSFEAEGGGSLTPDTDTHGSPANVSIENAGNVEVDLSYSGTNLSNGNGDEIDVSNVHLDTDQDGDLATNERTLATSKQTDGAFDLAASTDGTPSTAFVLAAIHVPSPIPTGSYTGSITLEAVAST